MWKLGWVGENINPMQDNLILPSGARKTRAVESLKVKVTKAPKQNGYRTGPMASPAVLISVTCL